MSRGRECDKCGRHLNDDDYTEYGSWHYNCPKCGFKYRGQDLDDEEDEDYSEITKVSSYKRNI